MKRSVGFTLLGILCVLGILSLVKVIQSIYGDGNVQINSGTGHTVNVHLDKRQSTPVKRTPVHSELRVPADAVLLERSELLNAIEHRFNASHRGITTIAIAGLVGMGGVGKTTLARMWGRLYRQKHRHASIWELNAETPTSLRNSFLDLATALAQTPQQKAELASIHQLQDPDTQERQRLSFVKSCLKEQPGWLLIFDNVESYIMIQKYLPQDPAVWGKGHVLITTRNVHLQGADIIKAKNMIHLEELSTYEALQLFCRIRFGCEPEKCPVKEQDQVKDFLEHIPPFPLDISIAAKYIGNYKLTPKEYLAVLDKQDVSFLDVQRELLKDGGDYTKTRYEIITLSLQKIIEKDKGNLEKLVLLSLMDSQNIPRDMLNHTSEGMTEIWKADKFIREMLHHALITLGTAPGDIGTLSMHRSTQEIMSTYVVNTQKLNQSHPVVRTVIRGITDYVDASIDEEKRCILRLLEHHGKRIVSSELLTEEEQMKVVGMLGCICYYVHKEKGAQTLLERSIPYTELNIFRDQRRLAQLYFHLGRVYLFNCNFTKAEVHLNKALHGYRSSKNISGQINAVCSLSEVYLFTGDLLKANEVLDTVQQINTEHTFLPRERMIRSYIARELGNPHHALELMNEVIKYRETMNQQDDETGWYFIYQGLNYRAMGDYAAANTWAEKGDTLYSHYDITSRMYAELKIYRSGIHRMLGNYVEAAKGLQFALTICEREPEETTADEIGYAKTALAKVYRNTGYIDTALKEAKEAEKLYICVFGDKNLYTAWIQMTLAQLYNDQGNYSDARNLL